MLKIANAALEILEEAGAEALSVAAVVERAGVSVGSFYARFSGKEEFLTYLEAVRQNAARQAWEEILGEPSWGGLSLGEALERIVARMWDLDGRKGGIGHEAGGSEAGPSEAGRENSGLPSGRLEVEKKERLWGGIGGIPLPRGSADDPGREPILSFLSRWAEEIPHPAPEVPLAVGYAMVRGALREFGPRERHEPPGRAGEDLIARELARAWLAYLTTTPPSRPDSMEGGPVASPSGDREPQIPPGPAGDSAAPNEPGAPREVLDYFDPWS